MDKLSAIENTALHNIIFVQYEEKQRHDEYTSRDADMDSKQETTLRCYQADCSGVKIDL